MTMKEKIDQGIAKIHKEMEGKVAEAINKAELKLNSTPCPQCGDRMFPSVFDPTKDYCVMCNQHHARKEA